jgi:hypothetical protein
MFLGKTKSQKERKKENKTKQGTLPTHNPKFQWYVTPGITFLTLQGLPVSFRIPT